MDLASLPDDSAVSCQEIFETVANRLRQMLRVLLFDAHRDDAVAHLFVLRIAHKDTADETAELIVLGVNPITRSSFSIGASRPA